MNELMYIVYHSLTLPRTAWHNRVYGLHNRQSASQLGMMLLKIKMTRSSALKTVYVLLVILDLSTNLTQLTTTPYS